MFIFVYNIILNKCTRFSTLSSGLNSLTAVVIHDFIQPLSKNTANHQTSMLLSKILGILIFTLQISICLFEPLFILIDNKKISLKIIIFLSILADIRV